MKRINMRILYYLLTLNFCGLLFSQNLKEAQLPKPNQMSLTYLNSLGEKNILYGKTPPNYNGELIIFSHGYIGSTESMLIGNIMYKQAYEEGYKTAFVATTRGKGLWVNGAVLGQAIDQVTKHFNVPKAYLVVHSNGGKASEVALFHENKRSKIKRVISLGTPFHGTQLADLSQNWWFKWLWSLTGLNDGAALSTTYYCENVVRPYFDKHALNQPKKYYNLGVWGWNKGHTILKPAFFTAGGYIFLDGGGRNDGVTPYYSSKRPGGHVILPYDGSAKGYYDHIDILYGQYSWQYIRPYLNNKVVTTSNRTHEIIEDNPYYEIVSDYQLVYSENEYEAMVLSGKQDVEVTLFHENPQAQFSTKMLSSSRRVNDYTMEMVVKKQDVPNFTIKSDSKYVAVVKESNKAQVQYRLNKKEKHPILSVNILDDMEKEAMVSAIITHTHDLYGNAISNPKSEVTFFKWNEKQQEFQLETKSYSEGIYSLYLTAELEGNFKRNIASGFTIGKITEKSVSNSTSNDKKSTIATLVNDVYSSSTQIKVKNSLKNTQINIVVYDLSGHALLTKQIIVKNEFISFNRDIQKLSKGVYLIAIKTQEGNETLKFIKK